MLIDPTISVDEFRTAMSSWATGVSIITGFSIDGSDKPIGILCNSLASISLNEKLILWSVDKATSSYSHWIKVNTFIVHFLAEDQRELVTRFAKKGLDKFEGLSFERTALGNPILAGTSVLMECSSYQIFDTPDHAIIIGELKTLVNNNKPPLLYLHSALENSSALT